MEYWQRTLVLNENQAEIQRAIDSSPKEEKVGLQNHFFNIAAETGKISILNFLLKQGVSVNSKVNGMTALDHAVFSRDLPTVKWLVEMGADVNSEDYSQQTPLLWTTHTICLPIENSQATTMYSMTKCLLENGAKVNAVNTYGLSIFHSACQSGVISIVKLLAENGANFFTQYHDGDTPPNNSLKIWSFRSCSVFN